MFRFLPIKHKTLFSSLTPFRSAKVHSTPNSSSSGTTVTSTDGYFELFRTLFRTSITREVELEVPRDLKVHPLSYAVIHVDASWADGKKLQLGLTVRSLNGMVSLAKTCFVNVDSLIPSVLPRPKSDDMVFAELVAYSLGVVTGIELKIPYFDIITDSQKVMEFLTCNTKNFYKRPEHQFLAISNKILWFNSKSVGFGSVSWIPSIENHNADFLSRCCLTMWGDGILNSEYFWNMVRDDVVGFKGTLVAIMSRIDKIDKNEINNALKVTKGAGYEILAKQVFEEVHGVCHKDKIVPPGCGVKDAYCLLNFGDSITTDHVSPAGSILRDSPVAKYLMERGVDRKDFNSYGSRRGIDEVIARGTIANIRIVNKLLNGEVGHKTIHIPTGEKLHAFDAATGAEEFYKKMDENMKEIPNIARITDGIIRNAIHYDTVPSWTRRFAALPSLHAHNLLWLQLLQVDEQKTAQLKMYALGSRVALTDDDSNVVERSRKLFKDAAPFFLKDFDRWIFSRSLVRKGCNGFIDDVALKFTPYDPLELLSELPLDPSAGIRCAETFLFFAVDGDVPGDDLCSREAVMDFLNALNSEDGTRKIHAFTVTAGSVVAPKEKLEEFTGKHLTA